MKVSPRRRPRYPNLRAYLAASGQSQTQLARALGVSQAQVSRLLAGKVMPRPALAIRLARYARIPVDSLMEAAARQKDHAA